MKFLFRYLSPLKRRMSLGFLIKVAGTVVELFLPIVLSHILENVIITLRVEKIVFFGLLMILLALSACVLNIIANRMAAGVARDFSQKMRGDLFERTLYLGARDTDAFTVPSLESRITSDTYNVHNFVGMMQRMGVRAPILLIGGLIVTMIMDIRLSLVMLAILPLIFITTVFVSLRGVKLYKKVQKSVDSMVRVVREDVQGIRVIKALSKEDYENDRYNDVNRTLSKDERRAGIIMGTVNPAMTLLMNLGIVGVVAVGALMSNNDPSSSVKVIAFMQYFTLIANAMMALSRIFVMYTKCSASCARIKEVIDTEDTYTLTEKSEKGGTGAHISFDNVSFSYLGGKKNIDSVSFSLERGDTLGIIGATGSGKSTLVKLLIRAYDADEGVITVDGESISSYTRDELTHKFGVVLQNGFLFDDTVAENIAFATEIDEQTLVRAAKTAQAHDFISELEGGYMHEVAPKGTNLSGGQRQRLLIARAIARNPEILILDDSSSALDYKTDANLRAALRENMRGTTVITVAQRVSSVKDCDLILVLDNGRVIGSGTHEHLMSECAEYKEIAESQMGGAVLE